MLEGSEGGEAMWVCLRSCLVKKVYTTFLGCFCVVFVRSPWPGGADMSVEWSLVQVCFWIYFANDSQFLVGAPNYRSGLRWEGWRGQGDMGGGWCCLGCLDRVGKARGWWGRGALFIAVSELWIF